MTIQTQTLRITSAGGSFDGYFAAPEAQDQVQTVPGVVVVQEIFGVNGHIRSVVDRLATAGYAVLAPDTFWRVEPGIELGYEADDVARGRDLKAKMNMDEVIEDVRATFDVLSSRPECAGSKLGITGFCYGGLVSYVAAARLNPACASSYYGGGIVDYLNEASAIDCPIQFHFGSEDQSIPADHIEPIRAAMADRASSEINVYEGAGHGFHCDERGSYDADSAALAWERTLGLFSHHLGS